MANTALLDDRYSFRINGIGFKAKTFKISWESLAADDSGRTLDGVMHIYWVRRNVRKIEITMPPCEYYTIQTLVNLVQGKEYNLTYWDPVSNGSKTIRVYTSNSQTDMYSGVIHNGLYNGFEFHAIELAGDE